MLFLDITCPTPYDAATLRSKPQGGTESTVTRVAEALAEQGHDVIVAQHNRVGLEPGEGKASYLSFEALDAIQKTPSSIFVLRDPRGLSFARKQFGADAKLHLWCHDYNLNDIIEGYPVIQATRAKILGVSRTHKTVIADAILSQIREPKGVTVDFVYNPIADELKPDSTTVFHKKLVYFSSPHKGLGHTLTMFKRIRNMDPHYELYIANPGYTTEDHELPAGVTNLGTLSHDEVLKHVRSAFCVFHMNKYPETFGLVYAEALAVGTPILTSQHSRALEILGNQEYEVDVDDEREVYRRLCKWQTARPETKVNEEFRLSNVIKEWGRLI